jgi:hypothetical protein
MSDIVKELRKYRRGTPHYVSTAESDIRNFPYELLEQAANEIESLRADNCILTSVAGFKEKITVPLARKA